MGSKMKVDWGQDLEKPQESGRVPFLWKGKALGQFPWNSTAIQTGMTTEEMECRQLSFYFHLKVTFKGKIKWCGKMQTLDKHGCMGVPCTVFASLLQVWEIVSKSKFLK